MKNSVLYNTNQEKNNHFITRTTAGSRVRSSSLLGRIFQYSAVSVFSLCMFSCSQEKKEEPKVEIREVLPAPFHFHKTINIKPGLSYDVLSWGRGSGAEGQSLLILAADTSASRYSVVDEPLEGAIVDAWNMDMDSDGNPELFIETRQGGKKKELKLYAFEFNDRGNANPIRVPELREATRRTYRGQDSIYVKSGLLFRSFPVFEEADTAGAKATGKMEFEYELQGGALVVK